MVASTPSRLEIWLVALATLGLSVFASFRLVVWKLAPRPLRLVPRAGETRVAFAPTADALEKYRMFKMEKGLDWLSPETGVLIRVRGPAASFVEIVTGEQRGRVGYVEAALVEDGWH